LLLLGVGVGVKITAHLAHLQTAEAAQEVIEQAPEHLGVVLLLKLL
jgi:hypothetical protein